MISKICILISLFFFLSCNNYENNREDFKFSYNVCENYFIEVFRAEGFGVFGGELDSHFITDSINFRKYLGVADEYGSTDIYCNNDTIFIKIYTGKKDYLKYDKIFLKKELVGLNNYKLDNKISN